MGTKLGLGLYLAIVHVCTIAFLVGLFYAFPITIVPWVDVLIWLVISLGANLFKFNSAMFGEQRIRRSVGFAPATASAVLFSPPLAALIVAVSTISWQDIVGKTELHKVAYNRSMYVLCGGLAAMVYHSLVSEDIAMANPMMVLVAGLLAALAYFLVNHSLVRIVVAIASGRSIQEVYKVSFGPWYSIFTYLTLGAMGISLAMVYSRIGIVAVLVLSLPLVATYQALSHISLVQQFYIQIIQSFADSIDLREHETAGHSQRIAAFARRVAESMGIKGSQLERIYIAGLLHDLGKIGWRDAILLKPEELTEEEWEMAKQHPADGAKLLHPYPHLREVAPLIAAHHEKYDGSGYPHGLAGENIPLGARILSVVDAVDAMYFGRPYRRAKPMDEIIAELIRCSGTHFDPRVVTAFLALDVGEFLKDHARDELEMEHVGARQ